MLYTTPPKKNLIINILDILKKYSDENHRLSGKDIGDRLEREYSQKVDRKTIKRNLLNLIDSGYEIEYSETIRTNKKGKEETIYSDWYLNRDFADAELRLLIDSLLFSKHIPYNQCKELIEKLESLSSIYFKAKVKHIRNMPEKLRENRELFYTIEILDEAISERKKVSFYYNDYGLDKKPYPRKGEDGKPTEYIVSPYQMAATNSRYYLIGNRNVYPDASNFRIDRISAIRLLDEPAKPMKQVVGLEKGLNLPKHMAEGIYMFTGKSVQVKFRTKQSLISDILDWFGHDVRLRKEEDDNVIATVTVNEQAMFYWSMQYGEHIEVLSPESLREKLGEAAGNMAEKYG